MGAVGVLVPYVLVLPLLASEPYQLGTYLQPDRVFFLLFGWTVLVVTFAQGIEDDSEHAPPREER